MAKLSNRYRVCAYLKDAEMPMTCTKIATELELTPTQVSNVLYQMGVEGVIEKHEPQGDGIPVTYSFREGAELPQARPLVVPGKSKKKKGKYVKKADRPKEPPAKSNSDLFNTEQKQAAPNIVPYQKMSMEAENALQTFSHALVQLENMRNENERMRSALSQIISIASNAILK